MKVLWLFFPVISGETDLRDLIALLRCSVKEGWLASSFCLMAS